MTKEAGYITGVFVAVAIAAIVGPLLAIWSVNTLFGLGIAYSLKTWFAAFVLMASVRGYNGGSKE